MSVLGVMVWNGESFDTERLRVINLPVLKSHRLFGQTGAVKGYMDVVSDRLTRIHVLVPAGRAHFSVGTGGRYTNGVYTYADFEHHGYDLDSPRRWACGTL